MNLIQAGRLQDYLNVLKKYKYLASVANNIANNDERWYFKNSYGLNSGLCFFALEQGFRDSYHFWADFMVNTGPAEITSICSDFDRFHSRFKGITIERINLVNQLIDVIEEVLEQLSNKLN